MSIPQIRFKTEGFRAIHSADIILDGITVVSGENGCGKSTLSKLLYHYYKSATNFESLVIKELRSNIWSIEQFLEIVIFETTSLSNRNQINEELHDLLNSERISEAQLQKCLRFMATLKSNYMLHATNSAGEKLDLKKLTRLKSIIEDLTQQNDIPDIGFGLEKAIEFFEKAYHNSLDKLKQRPTSLFLTELPLLFRAETVLGKFEIYEFEALIASLTKTSLSIPYLIQKAICIETPMIFGDMGGLDRTQLSDLLKQNGRAPRSSLSNTTIENIIGGSISRNEGAMIDDEFIYKRSDGEEYYLVDCATGIKAFAILQLLLKNGHLNNKTLLIIDEPESNLHPQWIVEYARVLVFLNKELGVRFFIASHNPDMVSAIKYISEKEGIAENLNFYLAERVNSTYTYAYKHLGTDIDPIFASFNIAIERMNQYGG